MGYSKYSIPGAFTHKSRMNEGISHLPINHTNVVKYVSYMEHMGWGHRRAARDLGSGS